VTPDKSAVLAALRERLETQLADLTAAQKSAQAGAFHPENKQEHSKDTRAIEASYLARGLAERVETLRDGIAALALLRLRAFGEDDPIAAGALVTLVAAGGTRSLYFLAPAGGGEQLTVGGCNVQVLTPRSPLGAAVAGRHAGDGIEVELPSGKLIADVDAVR